MTRSGDLAPEVLFRQPSDFAMFGGFQGGPYHSGRRWYGYPDAIAAVRSFVVRDDLCSPKAAQRMRQRVSEILQVYNQWEADCRAIKDRCGYTEVSERDDDLTDQARELRRAVVAIPAVTFEGVLAKAEIITRCYSKDLPDMLDVFGNDLKRSGPTAETMVWGLATDLARIILARAGKANV